MSGSSDIYEVVEFSKLINQDLLPSKFYDSVFNPQRVLERIGFKFEKPVGHFIVAHLPKNWRKISPELYWGVILDGKGRKRVSFHICTKIDRQSQSYTTVLTRYFIFYDHQARHTNWVVYDRATNRIVYRPRGSDNRYEQRLLCGRWLGRNYPDWENPGKYWDDLSPRKWWLFW